MKEYIIANKRGDRFYYKDKARTIRHREDGPAMEYADDDKMWFINGVYIFTIDKSGNITSRMR